MIRSIRAHRGIALAGLTIVLANLFIGLTTDLYLQAASVFVLSCLLPGFSCYAAILGRESSFDLPEKALLGAGLGYVSLVLGGLFLCYVPGPLTKKLVVLSYDLIILALLLFCWRKSAREPATYTTPPSRSLFFVLLGILVVAGTFRLPNLGYSEFQGDEVAVLHKAAACVQGRDDAIFYHKKGPAEIMIPATSYAITRRMNERVGRLPFTLANLVAVIGLYVLGKRFLSLRTGLWAALLIAVNGFFCAFARIIQYQSLVFLFSVLGLYTALLFDERFDRRMLWLSALFLATGLLAHTDVAFAALASAFVILRAFWKRRTPLPQAVRWLVGPILLGSLLLAAFYVPFVLHPHFEVAKAYLEARQGRPPHNNLQHLLNIGTVYNTVYYLAFMGLGLVGVALASLWRVSRPRWLLPLLCLGLIILSWCFPQIWRVGEHDFIGVFFLFLFVGLFAIGDGRAAWRPCLLWFGVPFLLYLFWFADPRTHLYIVFPGASLLLGVGLDRLGAVLKRKAWVLHSLVALVFASSACYLFIVFVDHNPEYKRTYPEHRLRAFWVPYGDEMPQTGLFGFPYKTGWKVIGYLYEMGVLQGDYGTNEETHITRWYTRGAPACASNPRYYFMAENVQDVQYVPEHEIAADYALAGRVWVGDQVKLRMYEQKPPRLAYQEYHLSEIAGAFDREVTDPGYPTGLESVDPMAEIQHPVTFRLGEHIALVGYDLDRAVLRPGEAVMLTLYWRALSPIAESYTVFTHVEAPGVLWGQKDSVPCCATCPTNEWQVGRVYVDPYTLVLDPGTPLGSHDLLVGMYHYETGARLPVFDAAGVSLGDMIHLGTIDVTQP